MRMVAQNLVLPFLQFGTVVMPVALLHVMLEQCHGIRDVNLAARHPTAASSFVTDTSMPISLLA